MTESPVEARPAAAGLARSEGDRVFQLRPSCPEDLPHLVDVWRRSVRATHLFLSETDFREIESAVAGRSPTDNDGHPYPLLHMRR